MLPKPYRLTKEKDFSVVYKRGGSVFTPTLVLRYMKRKGIEKNEQSCFGFVVSGKTAKKANVRNKIKRRLRAIIEKKLNEIPAGYNFVLIARSGIVKKDYQSIRNDVESLFRRTGIIKNQQR